MRKKKQQQAKAQQVNPLTPVVMLGATWLATQLAEVVYKSVTGKQPPRNSDPEEKLLNIAIWTAALTGVVTLTELAVNKFFESDRD